VLPWLATFNHTKNAKSRCKKDLAGRLCVTVDTNERQNGNVVDCSWKDLSYYLRR